MAVYVDDLRTYGQAEFSNTAAMKHGQQWCHMYADTLHELHQLAETIGLRRSWFQWKGSTPHYDLTPNKRRLAVQNGAVEVGVEKSIELRRAGVFKRQFQLLGRVASDE